MNKKKQSTRIKDLKAENYDLRVRNEFLENRIAIIESKKGFEITKIKSLTKEERVELLEKIRSFKAFAVSFIDNSKNNKKEEKKEEKKEVELVRGEWYCQDQYIFRYENKEHQFSVVLGSVLFTDIKGFLTDSCKEATTEQIKQGITLERDNGYFWNDEKQDYLKLEDVYYKAKNRNDLIDIINTVEINLLSKTFNSNISCPYVCIAESRFVLNTSALETLEAMGRIELTKEVFIKPLKNYKG